MQCIDFSWNIPAGSSCYTLGFSWNIQRALFETLLAPTRYSGYTLNVLLEPQHFLDSAFLAWSCYALNIFLAIPTLSWCNANNIPAGPWCYTLGFLLARVQHAVVAYSSWCQHALHATLWTSSWNFHALLMLRCEASLETVEHAPDAMLHHGLDSTVWASSWTFQRALAARLLIPTLSWCRARSPLLKHSGMLPSWLSLGTFQHLFLPRSQPFFCGTCLQALHGTFLVFCWENSAHCWCYALNCLLKNFGALCECQALDFNTLMMLLGKSNPLLMLRFSLFFWTIPARSWRYTHCFLL